MGKWFVNDFPLSRLAFNVRNRSAGWSMAGRRGENQVVPGRSGAIHSPFKPAEQGSVSLEMFAVGADHDGTMPSGLDRRLTARNHLDTLTRIFGSGDLLEIARTEDDTVQFGRTNLIENPSMEIGEGEVVVQRNVLQNPRGALTSGRLVTSRHNRARNPHMWHNALDPTAKPLVRSGSTLVEADKTETQTRLRTNRVLNPRMQKPGVTKVDTYNWVPNPGFEVDLKHWVARNSRISRVRTSIGGQGSYVMAITANTTGADASASVGKCLITPGQAMTVQAKVRNTSAVTRGMRVEILWYTEAGVYHSITSALTNVGPRVQTRITATGTAPTAATLGAKGYAVVRVMAVAAAANETFYVDDVMLETGGAATPYFDGATKKSGMFSYRWRGAAGHTDSERIVTLPDGYSHVTATNAAVAQYDGESWWGRYSAAISAKIPLAVGTALLRSTFQGAGAAGPLKQVSGSVMFRTLTSAARQMILRFECFDSQGVSLGYCRTTSGGATVASVTRTVTDDAWVEAQLDGVWTLAGTAKVGIHVTTNTALLAGDILLVSNVLLEEAPTAGLWFDGSVTDNETYEHDWNGTQHWSVSFQSGMPANEWHGDANSLDFRVVDEEKGAHVLRAVPRIIDPAVRVGVYQVVSTGVVPGNPYSGAISMRASRAQAVVLEFIWYDRFRKVISITSGAPVSLTAGTWARVYVTGAVAPAGATAFIARARSNVAPIAGEYLEFDDALWEEVAIQLPMFRGDSGVGPGGAPYAFLPNGEAIQQMFEATGWSGVGSALPRVYQSRTAGQAGVAAWARRDGSLGVTNGADDVAAGDTYTFSIDVYTGAASSILCGIAWKNKAGVTISQSTSTTTSTAGAFTRVSVTGVAPEGAVMGYAYAQKGTAVAGESVVFRYGRFGLGTETSYKDGATAGWRWTDATAKVPELGTSYQYATRLPHYAFGGGTLVRSNGWKARGSWSGLFVADGSSYPFIEPQRLGKERYFEVREDEPYTGRVTVRAREACRARLIMYPATWDGYQWTHGPSIAEKYVDLAAAWNSGSDLFVTAVPAPAGSGWTHVRIRLFITTNGASSGSTSGNGAYVDEWSLTADRNPEYIDGTVDWVEWLGEPHRSPSRVYGPARVAKLEVREAIDMTSMAGGTRAEFAVTGQIPDTYWSDPVERIGTYALNPGGTEVFLEHLAGGTAPIEDAIFEISGPLTSVMLIDPETEAWISIDTSEPVNAATGDDGTPTEEDIDRLIAAAGASGIRTQVKSVAKNAEPIVEGDAVVINCSDWTVRRRATGESLIGHMAHGGSHRLLPITVGPLARAPRLIVVGEGFGEGTQLTVVARRRFHIA